MDPFQTSIVTPLLPCHPPDSFWVPALLGGGKAAYDQVPDKVGTGSGCMVGAPDRLQAGEAKTRVKGADPYWIEGPGGPAAGRPPYSLLPDPYLYHSTTPMRVTVDLAWLEVRPLRPPRWARRLTEDLGGTTREVDLYVRWVGVYP